MSKLYSDHTGGYTQGRSYQYSDPQWRNLKYYTTVLLGVTVREIIGMLVAQRWSVASSSLQ